ncbi:MAG TPA: alpha/beta hydrolase [Candidatus Limnocylindria bacterium]
MTTPRSDRRHALSDGHRIVFEDVGEGATAIVFIHGAFGGRSHYASQIAHLAGRHRVLALDLRGHGDSDAPADGYRVRDFARDVIAVCHTAGLERAFICGHSIGAAIALEVAAQEPALVAGIVMLDGAVLFPEPALRGRLASFAAALETEHWREALEGFFGDRMFSPYDSPELKTRIMGELRGARREMAATMMRDLFASDYADQISASDHPLLFIHSEIPIDLVRLRQLRPEALVGEVVGAGHYAMLEVPDQVNAMLDRFLQIASRRGEQAPSLAP